MLRAEELRIGNLVRLRNSEIDIEACVNGVWNDTARGRFSVHLEGNGIINTIDQIEGVPLTEEWLEKFRFVKEDSDVNDYEDDYQEWYEKLFPVIGVLCQSDTKEYLFDEDTDTLRIKYVHELQNLYFALTSKELTIKVEEE